MTSIIKKYKWPLLILCGILIAASVFVYSKLFSANTAFSQNEIYVLIYENTDWQTWLDSQDSAEIVRDKLSFSLIARLKKIKTIRTGRYKFIRGMSNNEMINMLRIARQAPVKIRIDNTANIYELAGKLGKNLKSDSAAFAAAFTSSEKFNSLGFSGDRIACLIRPDTYEFYWTMTPGEFLDKMYEYHTRFFDDANLEKAKQLNLTPAEAYILASIVKAETAKKEEAPKIAGLYLNRLRIGMALESDPTAVFAAGLKHMARVKGVTEIDSPYNTYNQPGLPPGPINFAEELYLEAVLNPEKHNYIFMCAQPGNTGYHNFSVSFEQHKEYARLYRKWLDEQGIR